MFIAEKFSVLLSSINKTFTVIGIFQSKCSRVECNRDGLACYLHQGGYVFAFVRLSLELTCLSAAGQSAG